MNYLKSIAPSIIGCFIGVLLGMLFVRVFSIEFDFDKRQDKRIAELERCYCTHLGKEVIVANCTPHQATVTVTFCK